MSFYMFNMTLQLYHIGRNDLMCNHPIIVPVWIFQKASRTIWITDKKLLKSFFFGFRWSLFFHNAITHVWRHIYIHRVHKWYYINICLKRDSIHRRQRTTVFEHCWSLYPLSHHGWITSEVRYLGHDYLLSKYLTVSPRYRKQCKPQYIKMSEYQTSGEIMDHLTDAREL